MPLSSVKFKEGGTVSPNLPRQIYSGLEQTNLGAAVKSRFTETMLQYAGELLTDKSQLQTMGSTETRDQQWKIEEIRLTNLCYSIDHQTLMQIFSALGKMLYTWTLQMEHNSMALLLMIHNTMAEKRKAESEVQSDSDSGCSEDLIDWMSADRERVRVIGQAGGVFGWIRAKTRELAARFMEGVDSTWIADNSRPIMNMKPDTLKKVLGRSDARWCYEFVVSLASINKHQPRLQIAIRDFDKERYYVLFVTGISRWSAVEHRFIHDKYADRITRVIYNIQVVVDPGTPENLLQGGAVGFAVLRETFCGL